MIIWIDGPFGAGKTTLATRLCEKRSDLLVSYSPIFGQLSG